MGRTGQSNLQSLSSGGVIVFAKTLSLKVSNTSNFLESV